MNESLKDAHKYKRVLQNIARDHYYRNYYYHKFLGAYSIKCTSF